MVGGEIYGLWQAGPWELPKPPKARGVGVLEGVKKEAQPPQPVTTKEIIEKNLFDPERGAGGVAGGGGSSATAQRIRNMVLTGTIVLGNSRYAILQEPSLSAPPPVRGQAAGPVSLHLKVGDTLEGYRLSEIQDRKVVFTKGGSRIEVSIDFFRKIDDSRGQTQAPTQPRPGVAPAVPRRDRLPAPPVAR